MKTNWNYPTTIWVGENRIQDLSIACKNLKIEKPLFVTDKDLINLKMVQDIILDLKKTFNHLQVFSNFSGNPVGENVVGKEQMKLTLHLSLLYPLQQGQDQKLEEHQL